MLVIGCCLFVFPDDVRSKTSLHHKIKKKKTVNDAASHSQMIGSGLKICPKAEEYIRCELNKKKKFKKTALTQNFVVKKKKKEKIVTISFLIGHFSPYESLLGKQTLKIEVSVLSSAYNLSAQSFSIKQAFSD